MDKAVCVPVTVAQTVRKSLEKCNLWDDSRKLKKLGDTVAIPVHFLERELSAFLQTWSDAEVKEVHLPPSAKCSQKTDGKRLKEMVGALLKHHRLSDALLLEVPKKWERHGNLIILPSSSFVSSQWCLLGEELWLTVASALCCQRLAHHSHVANNDFRSPQVLLLLGHDGNVVHVDNGVEYSFDVTKCMFSSGNVSEKLRVASWDCSNEVVVDLYAGIGYFTLPYLVHARARHVHACEWNPDAIAALRINLTKNGVQDRCTVYEGDNRKLGLMSVADRVNLGLIPSSEDGWPVAVRVLKDTGGVLHIHANVQPQRTRMDKDQSSTDASVTTISYHSACHGEGTPKDSYHANEEGCVISGSSESNLHLLVPDESVISSDLSSTGNERMAIRSPYETWALGASNQIELLLTKEKGGEWDCEVIHIEKVKSYAPCIDHVVLDLRCKQK